MKVKITVEGRVQGVGFRYMTKMVADKVGVFGIVRNKMDGSVYIEANGSTEKVDEFISLVRSSPSPSGRVDTCHVEFDDSLPERTSFDVTY